VENMPLPGGFVSTDEVELPPMRQQPMRDNQLDL